MRAWLIALISAAALLAAIAVAPLFRDNAGYVLIELGGWTLETNVPVLALGLVAALVLLRLSVWLLGAPRRAARNLARRRLENGLLALAEGKWKLAETSLSKAAGDSGMQTAGYLAAARAADNRLASDPDTERRQQQYLLAADDGRARTRFLIELSKARILIGRNHHQQAVTILRRCLRQRRRHPQALRMLAACYRELGYWKELRQLLPALRKAGVIDRRDAQNLERMTVINELEAAPDAEQLQRTWDSLLRSQRRCPRAVAVYARRALAFELPRLAQGALVQALDEQLDDELLDLYGRTHLEPTAEARARARQWRRREPDNAAVERLLGQLYLQDKVWGKARNHLQESLRLKPDRRGFELLGKLLEQHGYSEAAANCYYNALQLESGETGAAKALRPIYPEGYPERPALDHNGRDRIAGAGGAQQPALSESDRARRKAPGEEDAMGEVVTMPAGYTEEERAAAGGDQRGAKSNES